MSLQTLKYKEFCTLAYFSRMKKIKENRERKYDNEWVNTTLHNWGMLKIRKCINCNKELTNTGIKRCNECHKKYTENRRKIYLRSKKGKEMISKIQAKQRGLGWIKITENPFDKSVKVAWHHVNNTYVIAVPKGLHHSYNNDINKHRFMMCNIIRQIYAPTNSINVHRQSLISPTKQPLTNKVGEKYISKK